ncbi:MULTISPECIES: aldo/keto reductase [Ensifer]|jgi:aryl-alcohol dehydrogenase-like predicted oxidoreductase|uniref:Aldo/keto reductase n=1 Tax=Ensifer canadensis TaxID=555315 RepID=A0AAW4FMG7_9HYPH|nr:MULTISPECIES: aldo/keto reductase [Ensifer]KQU83102.1 NADP-dependent oxidoreductase [Ensifer sp. Root31]KQW59830.1 NADP-dependent oxidoreductase [Ensifer sp. Root1252]KQW78614.1 NADP-dependent oxidoreductase [Ensifer sp. Root127]KQY67120.1 NADP-dependent oxidoreductase [Ensifer sp. Root142]KRC74032.1 NADP-dependent oxidoreductase [Ensifer sp. Root231]
MVEYRYLGRSALKVSPLTLGSMMFGNQTPDDVAFRIIDKAREQGINFIDTADVYHDGKSEEVVGRGIKADRDHWVLATKFVNSHKKGPNLGGYSRKWVYQTVENSLRNLGTDYIDILYFHRAVFDAPLEEPVRAIADLIKAGKLRYFGVSNFRGWRIAEIAQLADELGIDRPVASQPLYNIVNRTAEAEQLPAAAAYGLGVVTYSPLARGVLTGKYNVGEAPGADTRAGRGDKRMHDVEFRDESIAIAKQIAAHAQAKGIPAADFALAWVLNNRLVTSTIGGPRTEEQWDGYVRALDVKIDADDEALVDRLVAAGHPSTPGFTDPGHPLEGRLPRFGAAEAEIIPLTRAQRVA